MTPPSCFYWSGYTNAMFNIEYTLNSKSVRVAANKTGARTSIGVAFGHHSGGHLTMMQVNSYFHQSIYWHEHAAFQRSSFGRSTAGNDVVVTIIISLFLFLARATSLQEYVCTLVSQLVSSKFLARATSFLGQVYTLVTNFQQGLPNEQRNLVIKNL